MVKITDVAKKAKVAKSTVSNVLTGKKFVSEQLRQKVLDACKELDFQPNFYASGLSNKKTNIIALLMETTQEVLRYPFYKDLILSCIVEASKQGYSLLVYYESDEEKLLKTLRQGRAPIDGAILMTPNVNDERLEQIQSNRTACVVLGRSASENISSVDIDNKKLVKTVTEKLIADYGTDVYLINSRADMTISQDRRAAFLEVCANYGIDSSHVYERAKDDAEESFEFAVERIKKNSVFITENETSASGVYKACQQKGLQVGKDVAVFALGRSIEHGKFTPSLSYASQNYVLLGQMAVLSLIQEIQTGEFKHALVESEICYRASTSKE